MSRSFLNRFYAKSILEITVSSFDLKVLCSDGYNDDTDGPISYYFTSSLWFIGTNEVPGIIVDGFGGTKNKLVKNCFIISE